MLNDLESQKSTWTDNTVGPRLLSFLADLYTFFVENLVFREIVAIFAP